MKKTDIGNMCLNRQQELLEKYFGNLVHEAAVTMPETIGKYDMELPKRIEAEYFEFLKKLWEEVAPNDSRRLEDVLDKKHLGDLMTEDDREGLRYAYDDAKRRTIWERISKSNHKDVTYYKGLLKVYAEELLDCMRMDFMEDVRLLDGEV